MTGFVYSGLVFDRISILLCHVTKQGNNQPSPSVDQHLYHWNLNVQVIVLEKASVGSLKEYNFPFKTK